MHGGYVTDKQLSGKNHEVPRLPKTKSTGIKGNSCLVAPSQRADMHCSLLQHGRFSAAPLNYCSTRLLLEVSEIG